MLKLDCRLDSKLIYTAAPPNRTSNGLHAAVDAVGAPVRRARHMPHPPHFNCRAAPVAGLLDDTNAAVDNITSLAQRPDGDDMQRVATAFAEAAPTPRLAVPHCPVPRVAHPGQVHRLIGLLRWRQPGSPRWSPIRSSMSLSSTSARGWHAMARATPPPALYSPGMPFTTPWSPTHQLDGFDIEAVAIASSF